MTSIRRCPFCGKIIDPSTNICDSCRDRINPNRKREEEKEEKKEIEVEEVVVETPVVEKKVYKCPLCGRPMKAGMACCRRCKMKLKASTAISVGAPIAFLVFYVAIFILFRFLTSFNKDFFEDGTIGLVIGYSEIMVASFIISLVLFIKAWKSAKSNQQKILLSIYKVILIIHIIAVMIPIFFKIYK